MYGTHVINIATRKANKPGWKWCEVKKVGGGAIVRGGVPQRTFSRGPRKGDTDWRGVALDEFVVSDDEVKQEEARLFAEGTCYHCVGEGQIAWRWTAEKGNEFKPCPLCKGTGKAGQP